jgi:hypothetical protein
MLLIPSSKLELQIKSKKTSLRSRKRKKIEKKGNKLKNEKILLKKCEFNT